MIPKLKLVDCHNRTIVDASHLPKSFALSSVWAAWKNVRLESVVKQGPDADNLSPHGDLSKVTEDTTQVMKELEPALSWGRLVCTTEKVSL